MNITYFLNFYPTKHKIIAHDEMIEMFKRGHQIRVIAVWGAEKDEAKQLPYPVFYLKHKVKWISFLFLLVKNPIKL